jgi:hypothetical protein
VTFRNRVLRASLLPAAFLALAAIAPASAQYWGPGVPPPDYSGRIPPQHIEAMVRSMGFQPVAEPRPRGPLWVTHATDRNGQHVRVLIDSFSGRVIDVLRRPMPPQQVALTPPNAPPPVNGAISDYDEGPDYDYREMPRQRPADWPPSRPNTQQPGPNVIPYEPRSDNSRSPNAPKKSTAKKKETKDKKNETAALKVEQEKEKAPSPKTRPADAPKADTPKAEAPKSAETPTFVPNTDQRPTGSVPPPPQTLEMNKSQPPSALPLPPVQPPF